MTKIIDVTHRLKSYYKFTPMGDFCW